MAILPLEKSKKIVKLNVILINNSQKKNSMNLIRNTMKLLKKILMAK